MAPLNNFCIFPLDTFDTFVTLVLVKEKTVNVRLKLPTSLHAAHKSLAALQKITLREWLLYVIRAWDTSASKRK